MSRYSNRHYYHLSGQASFVNINKSKIRKNWKKKKGNGNALKKLKQYKRQKLFFAKIFKNFPIFSCLIFKVGIKKIWLRKQKKKNDSFFDNNF